MKLYIKTVLAMTWLFLISSPIAYAGTVSVQVLSATAKDQKIEGATVILQENGSQSVTATTAANGQTQLTPTFLDDSAALVIIKKSGYSDLVAKCPCGGLTYALSPIQQKLDGMRIVLTWGSHPSDLDGHLESPTNNIYFGNKIGKDAYQDVDAVRGFGPETITITNRSPDETYVYAVHDFSDIGRPNAENLSQSQATVFVYIGESLVRTYYVPTGQPGNLWTVFRVTPSGEFQDINLVSGIEDGADKVYEELAKYNSAAQPIENTISADKIGQAKEINAQGESAYHQGRIEDSIQAYQQAIDLYPDYGQAYSNLGLSYQKLHRSAEAIWANRKAIALASGSTAPVVRASSYYNIGRLYEEAGQLSLALENYKAAKNEHENPVYDKAIKRVSNR